MTSLPIGRWNGTDFYIVAPSGRRVCFTQSSCSRIRQAEQRVQAALKSGAVSCEFTDAEVRIVEEIDRNNRDWVGETLAKCRVKG